MLSGQLKSPAAAGPPSLVLEIGIPGKDTPLLIPVQIRNLAMDMITLAVMNPWVIPDWDACRHRECILHLEDFEAQKLLRIKASVAWCKFVDDSSLPLSLGLQMVKPSAEAVKLLNAYLTHSARDMQGLWDKYDEVQALPTDSHLIQQVYIGGVVLLLGGVALQMAGSSSFRMLGWVLWFFGTLGVIGKIMWSLKQKRTPSSRMGNTLK